MHTHERSLVEQYKGQPFAIVGVNGDPDREIMRASLQKAGLSYQSVWDGRGGPIVRQWNIEGFPTIFLLDKHGVVRFKSVGPPKPPQRLEQAINQLLQEA